MLGKDIAEVGRTVVDTGQWGWGSMAAVVVDIAAVVVVDIAALVDDIAALVDDIAAVVVGIAAGFAAGRWQGTVAADIVEVVVGRLVVVVAAGFGRLLVAADSHSCDNSSTHLLPLRR